MVLSNTTYVSLLVYILIWAYLLLYEGLIYTEDNCKEKRKAFQNALIDYYNAMNSEKQHDAYDYAISVYNQLCENDRKNWPLPTTFVTREDIVKRRPR